MPDRVQVPDIYKDRGYLPSVQPVARPVDTFINPSPPQRDIRLLELAKAWSEVEPGLSKFANERVEHSNMLDAEEGRKAALANKAQFKDAVNKGVIPAGASPWFQVGYERQKATRTSLEYDQALKEAYAQTDLVNSTDPAAVNQWMAEFTAGWLETNPDAQSNPEFGRTFQVMGARSQDALQTLHAAQRTQKVEADAAADTDFMLGKSLDSGIDLLGDRNPNLGQELAGIVGEQVSNGLAGPIANKLVTDAVIRKAEAEGDVTVLDLLGEVPSGSGTVGQIGWVKDAVSQARDRIVSKTSHRDRINKLQNDEARKNQINLIRGDAYRKIAENPYADTSEHFDQLSRIDPDEAAKVESFRTSFLGSLNAQNNVIESNQTKTSMILDAMHGKLTEDQVMMAVTNQEIDAETAKDLLVNLIPKAKEQKSLLTDPAINRFEKSIAAVITKNELSDNFADQRAFRASEATSQFLMGMMDFKEKNPKATQLDILKHGRELQKEILEIYREDDAEPLPNVELKDTETKSLFAKPEDLDLAIQEFNKTQGTSGKLRAIADKLQVDPMKLITDQKLLFKKQTK
jgi:hypothetical protein